MKTKIILAILDGWGVAETWGGNAISLADTPTMNFLDKKYPHTLLKASGQAVGLPYNEPGNSEVGHQNIGSGQIVKQDLSSINDTIKDRSFYANPVLNEVFETAKQKGTLHLCGLLSDGGIHSHISHLIALLSLARKKGLKRVAIHAITDGRDTPPTSGFSFATKIEEVIKDFKVGKIASVGGRFYAMDRDNNWDRIEKYYNLISGQAKEWIASAGQVIKSSYASGVTDEFIFPTLIDKDLTISDGDSIVFFNYRTDRMREIVQALSLPKFSGFRRKKVLKNLKIATFSSYQEGLSAKVVFNQKNIVNPLVKVLSEKKLSHLHVAETEKYAHVTYFFNGGIEKPFVGESRILIPSPDVKTYNLKPEMSARIITQKTLERLSKKGDDFVVINFANPDMVGHTGNFDATIKAIQTVDQCLGQLIKNLGKSYTFLVTADHGNAEQMIDPVTGLEFTEHTINPVPFILVDKNRKKVRFRKEGVLADIAPTILSLYQIPKPKEMSGTSLIS